MKESIEARAQKVRQTEMTDKEKRQANEVNQKKEFEKLKNDTDQMTFDTPAPPRNN